MTTLEEAIKHCEEVAENHEKSCGYYKKHNMEEYVPSERKYIEEHRQLAEWLRELKIYREHTYAEMMQDKEVNADADSD